MEIERWQTLFCRAITMKYGKRYNTKDQILSLMAQVVDIAEEVQYLEGLKEKKRPGTIGEFLTSTMIDLFLLADTLQIDIEKELKLNLDWLTLP